MLGPRMWPGTCRTPGGLAFAEAKSGCHQALGRRPLQPSVAFPSDQATGPVTPSPARLRATAPWPGEGLWGRGEGKVSAAAGRLPSGAAACPPCPGPAAPRPSSRRDAGEIRNRGAQPLRDGKEETDAPPGRGAEGGRRRAATPGSAQPPARRAAGPAEEGEGGGPAHPRRGPRRPAPEAREERGPGGGRAATAGRAPAPSHARLGLRGLSRRWGRVPARRPLPPGSTAISWPPAAGTGGAASPGPPRSAGELPSAPGWCLPPVPVTPLADQASPGAAPGEQQ